MNSMNFVGILLSSQYVAILHVFSYYGFFDQLNIVSMSNRKQNVIHNDTKPRNIDAAGNSGNDVIGSDQLTKV